MKPDEPATPETESRPAPAATPEVAPNPADLAGDVARFTQENAALRAQLLERTADLDNQAKRFGRERQVVRDEIVRKFAREMLAVLDNLDWFLGTCASSNDANALADGVRLTREVLLQKLREFGIERIVTEQATFDPALHEAVQEQEDADRAPGTVLHELTAGFRMGTQLVRAAKVVVAKAPAARAATPKSS